ncbi:MAG: hypothetical protein ACYTFI_12960, partial [Planctomycetota bacterium]
TISSGLQRFFFRASPIEQPSLQMLTVTQGCPFQAEPEHEKAIGRPTTLEEVHVLMVKHSFLLRVSEVPAGGFRSVPVFVVNIESGSHESGDGAELTERGRERRKTVVHAFSPGLVKVAFSSRSRGTARRDHGCGGRPGWVPGT